MIINLIVYKLLHFEFERFIGDLALYNDWGFFDNFSGIATSPNFFKNFLRVLSRIYQKLKVRQACAHYPARQIHEYIVFTRKYF